MDVIFKYDGPHVGERTMIHTKNEYIEQLRELLKDHSDRDAIVDEISVHINECLRQDGLSEQEAISLAISQIGSPQQLAQGFIRSSTPHTTAAKKWFIYMNFMFFLAGGFLAVGANVLQIDMLQWMWDMLSQSGWTILLAYTGYWAFLGFEMGKEYGVSGKKLLSRTIGIAVIPNFILMLATLFGVLPIGWFHTLLNSSFLIACLLATFCFFPISHMGYYVGVRKAF